MAFEQDPANNSWMPPEGYYEQRAESDVNPYLHFAGRFLVSAWVLASMGRPRVVTSAGFEEARPEFEQGNMIVSAVHRDELDTVMLPSALERVGIHHARPIGKGELLDINPNLSWTLHGLGLIGVNRKNPDHEGLGHAQARILERGGIVTNYGEGTRVHKDVWDVSKFKRGIAMAAAPLNSLIVPVGIAGLSSERIGEKPKQKVIARDKRAPFGFGPKVVFAFGDPFRLGPLPDYDLDKNGDYYRSELSRFNEETKRRTEIIRLAVQRAHSRAYEVRGSILEVKY